MAPFTGSGLATGGISSAENSVNSSRRRTPKRMAHRRSQKTGHVDRSLFLLPGARVCAGSARRMGGFGALDGGFERADQGGAGGTEQVAVMEGELAEEAFAERGDADQHDAAVGTATGAADEMARFEAIEQLDETVMLQLEALGEVADRGLARGRSAFDGEKELVPLEGAVARVSELV